MKGIKEMNDLSIAMVQVYDFLVTFNIMPYLVAGVIVGVIIKVIKAL